MTFPNQLKGPKTLMLVGRLCLVAGLLLFLFVHPGAGQGRNWLHGITGLLIGISLSITLSAMIGNARQNRDTKA